MDRYRVWPESLIVVISDMRPSISYSFISRFSSAGYFSPNFSPRNGLAFSRFSSSFGEKFWVWGEAGENCHRWSEIDENIGSRCEHELKRWIEETKIWVNEWCGNWIRKSWWLCGKIGRLRPWALSWCYRGLCFWCWRFTRRIPAVVFQRHNTKSINKALLFTISRRGHHSDKEEHRRRPWTDNWWCAAWLDAYSQHHNGILTGSCCPLQ